MPVRLQPLGQILNCLQLKLRPDGSSARETAEWSFLIPARIKDEKMQDWQPERVGLLKRFVIVYPQIGCFKPNDSNARF